MKLSTLTAAALLACSAAPALAQDSNVSPMHQDSWSENCGWMNWRDAGSPATSDAVYFGPSFAFGFIWCENIGYINLGDGTPANATAYANTTGADFGVNIAPNGTLSGLAWGENVGWINFSVVTQSGPARIDYNKARLLGAAWGENIGWINLDHPVHFVGITGLCGISDFNGDGDFGTDADIEAFFACLAGNCCETCGTSDFNGDGDFGTDADIEAFFAVLAGGHC